MTYFKINDTDFSMYVNKLKVGSQWIYKSRTNSAGNTIAKPVSLKRVVEVGIIPLDDESVASLLTEVNKFDVTITFLNPDTNAIETINCIIPDHVKDYYTIRADKVMLNAFTLAFSEK